jgi:hypothetical protein
MTLILIGLGISAVLTVGQIPQWMHTKSHSDAQVSRHNGFKSGSPTLNVISNCGTHGVKPMFDPTPLTWNWTHNVSTTQNPTSVVKTNGNDSFNDAYAYSNESLSLDGDYLEWTMASNSLECSVALTAVYSNTFPGYPDFWANFYYGGQGETYYCTEGWANGGPGTMDCSGHYTSASVFKLIRRCDRIEFYVNNVKVDERIGTLPAQLYVVFQAGQLSAGANNMVVNSQPPSCSCPNIPIVP